MLLIFAGSSDALSAEHTSRFLVPFLLWLDPAISYQAIEAIHLVLRKIGHFTEYAILATLLWRALRGTFTSVPRRCIAAAALLVAAAFAISDEFHQSFVPSRTAAVHDVCIDFIGAAIAVLLCATISRAQIRSAGPLIES